MDERQPGQPFYDPDEYKNKRLKDSHRRDESDRYGDSVGGMLVATIALVVTGIVIVVAGIFILALIFGDFWS